MSTESQRRHARERAEDWREERNERALSAADARALEPTRRVRLLSGVARPSMPDQFPGTGCGAPGQIFTLAESLALSLIAEGSAVEVAT